MEQTEWYFFFVGETEVRPFCLVLHRQYR